MFHVGKTYSHAGIVVSWPSQIIHSWSQGGHGVQYADPRRGMLARRMSTALFFSPWASHGAIVSDRLRAIARGFDGQTALAS
jgi:hypothetical protein